jgi:DNA-binding FadR family transcriptional regulator
MVALEIAGLVEVRTGSGTYVRADGADRSFVPPDAGPSPFDLVAARKLIEPEIASAAATAASPADLAGIAETLEQMRAALAAGRDIRSADRLFHTRIAAATGNTVLVSVVDQLWEGTFAPIFNGLSRRVGLPENQRAAVDDHARILEALQRRAAAAARDAMRAHLAQVEAVMLADGPA